MTYKGGFFDLNDLGFNHLPLIDFLFYDQLFYIQLIKVYIPAAGGSPAVSADQRAPQPGQPVLRVGLASAWMTHQAKTGHLLGPVLRFDQRWIALLRWMRRLKLRLKP